MIYTTFYLGIQKQLQLLTESPTYIEKRYKVAAYLEAGVATKAFINDGFRGAPFINDDQPGTWLGTLRGSWWPRAFT